MHQRARRIVGQKGFENVGAGDGGGQRKRAAGESLAETQDVRRDPRLFAGEKRSRPPEADENLVRDQQHAMARTSLGDAAQGFGRKKFHSARALDQRLDQNGGDILLFARQKVIEGLIRGVVDRQFGQKLFRQIVLEQAVHRFVGVADRHAGHGVAVIAVAKRNHGRSAAFGLVEPILHRHFHRDFDRHRAAVDEKDF